MRTDNVLLSVLNYMRITASLLEMFYYKNMFLYNIATLEFCLTLILSLIHNRMN